MEKQQINQLMMIHSSKLSPEYVDAIRSRLAELDYDQTLMAFGNIKDPIIMLVISIFLGGLGIDRFMLGDYIMGGGKLVLLIAGWFLCGVTWIPLAIWGIIDWFLIMGATRKYNSEKLLSTLSLINN